MFMCVLVLIGKVKIVLNVFYWGCFGCVVKELKIINIFSMFGFW